MVKTTKITAGVYKIEGTSLVVCKSQAPRYGCPQEWDITPESNHQDILLTGTSKTDALARYEQLLRGGV